MKKIYKIIEIDEMHKVTIYGGNRNILLHYAVPEWNREKGRDYIEPYFTYQDRRYYLSEFMPIDKFAPDWMKEFDGYCSDSFFSGVVIKLDKEDSDLIKAFTYIS